MCCLGVFFLGFWCDVVFGGVDFVVYLLLYVGVGLVYFYCEWGGVVLYGYFGVGGVGGCCLFVCCYGVYWFYWGWLVFGGVGDWVLFGGLYGVGVCCCFGEFVGFVVVGFFGGVGVKGWYWIYFVINWGCGVVESCVIF